MPQSKGLDNICKISYKYNTLFSFGKKTGRFYKFKQLFNLIKIHEI
jgi:hypothetical protein